MTRSRGRATCFAAAVDLSTAPNFEPWLAVTRGIETGDYAAPVAALRANQYQMAAEARAALLSGYQALASRDPKARTKAVQALLSLPKDRQNDTVATMLAALGANREALEVARDRPWLFWRRSMRGVLNQPGFPAVAKQLRLMAYWKATHTKPDVCRSNDPPPFCGII